MTEKTKLKPCAFFLVRYVPDVVRDEGLNIGVFLHSPEEEYLDCMFTDDFRRIKRFHPQADLELLKELQFHFEQEIKENEQEIKGKEKETQLEEYLREMQETYSNMIQVTAPHTCLARDPQAEIQDLFARYVSSSRTAPLLQDTRMRIKQRLSHALEGAGVLDNPLFESRIPAGQWTYEGDPFSFDYGYRPPLVAGKPNGHIKLIHALSLKRDKDLAYKMAHTLQQYVRRKELAELTAVVEGLPGPTDETALHSQRILEDAQIDLQPLAGVVEFAQSVRRDLQM